MTYFPGILAVCSIGCLVAAGCMAWWKGAAAAAVMATLFVATAALAYMPQLDTFKAFSVEVRLNHTLAKADEVIKHLRDLSIANGRIAYRTEAIHMAFNAEDVDGLQSDLDAVDDELAGVEATPREILAMRRPYILSIGNRLNLLLYEIATNTYNGPVASKYFMALPQTSPDRASLTQFTSNISLRYPVDGDVAFWKKVVEGYYPGAILPADRRPAYRAFWDTVEAVYADCVRTGRVSDAAASILRLTSDNNFGGHADVLWQGKPLP